jgi:Flp pilus assembly protein TadD
MATLTVCVTLLSAFALTAFSSSVYHKKKEGLGSAHYQLGRTFETHGEVESALDEYRKALLFLPDNAEFRLSLATALLEANRLEEAESHLEQLLQENPTSGPINLLLGRLAVQQQKLKRAVEYYQRGVYEYWPESELAQRRQARWELATLLSRTGDRGGFVGELMQLYTNLPANDTPQKLKVANLLLTNGATSEAFRIFRDLSKLAPQNSEVEKGLGQAYFNFGDYVSARHSYQRSLKFAPSDSQTSQLLGLTNDVIDMDAALPYITATEQMRRNRNLLARVVKNLEQCGAATTSERLEDARELLSSVPKDQDPAFTLQTTAARLWVDRASFCGSSVPQDRALDTVFSRLGHE